MIKQVVATAFVGLNFYIYEFLATDEVIPAREPFAELPLALGEWRCESPEEMDARALKFLGATDYLLCSYRRPQSREPVDLYVGYHASQVRKQGGGGDAHAIHPPEHCLPGSGWDIIDSRRVPIAFAGLPTGRGLRDDTSTAKRFVIAKGEERQLVYFWYQGQGRVVTSNEDVILTRFWNRATRGRTDGALVRFTTRIVRGDVAAAEERFESLAAVVVPLMPRFVPD